MSEPATRDFILGLCLGVLLGASFVFALFVIRAHPL